MRNLDLSFRFMATGIGSVPFQDRQATCREILEQLPSMPFWPQFPKLSPFEDMCIQFSEGMPFIQADPEKRSLVLAAATSPEDALVDFYDRFLAHDLDSFAISREYAPGLYLMLDQLPTAGGREDLFFKGQTVGPVTFAAGILDAGGKPALHNPELLEALSSGLAIKARWQARQLSTSGRTPVIFMDEPYLSGFGSAFSPVQRDEVIRLLGGMIAYIREHTSAIIGIHCCGNTDWAMILDVQPDIVNFDAFEHLEYFLLYPDQIRTFVERGGQIAWGIVPTSSAVQDATVDSLEAMLKDGLARLRSKGLDPEDLAEHSILTPACGMGSMTVTEAQKAMALLGELSRRFRQM